MTRRFPSVRCPRIGSAIVLLVILAGAASPVVGEETFGRLFFTPERRQMLDRQREQNLLSQQEAPEEPTLTINGDVARSSGRRTVWVNGIAQTEKGGAGDLLVTPRRDDPARIFVQPSQAPAASARVGETINRNTGESQNLLGGGSISRHPPRHPGQ